MNKDNNNKISLEEIKKYYNITNNNYINDDEEIINNINIKKDRELINNYNFIIETYNNIDSLSTYKRLISYYLKLSNLRDEALNYIKNDNSNPRYKTITKKHLEMLLINNNDDIKEIEYINEYSKETEYLFRFLIKLLSKNYLIDYEEGIKYLKLITNNENEGLKIIKSILDSYKNSDKDIHLLITNDDFKKMLKLINSGYPSEEFNKFLFDDLIKSNNIYKSNNNIKTR